MKRHSTREVLMKIANRWLCGMMTGLALLPVPGRAGAAEAVATNATMTLPAAAPILDEAKPAAPAAATNEAPAEAAPGVAPAPPVAPVPEVKPAPEATPEVTPVPEEEVMKCGHPRGPWKVGARMIQFKLEETQRGGKVDGEYVNTYMGSISYLEEDQDNTPRLFAQYRIKKSPVWIGMTYDRVRAVTLEADKDPDHGDGTIALSGYVPYLHAAWENKTPLTPFVQLGYAFYKADFEANEWGAEGRRYVKVSDPNGLEIAGGLDVRLYKNLQLDLFVRQMNVDDVTGKWYSYGQEGGAVVFPLSNTAYGIGLLGQF
jgi:hypothetical protein